MSPVLAFWAAAMVTGALALPLSFRLFRRFPDGGAGLSFALGVTLAGWVYFMLRTADVLPAGRGGPVLALALLALAGAGAAGYDRRFLATVRLALPGIVAVAGVFSLAFFLFVAFRSYTPDIGGTEQPMDLMYLNAAMTSPGYPPHDPWLAGERASYYYFGYVQAGMLTQTAGVSAGEGYNLGLAYTFGAAAAGAASLGLALGRWLLRRAARTWIVGAAVTGVVLLLLVGSLAGVLEFAAAHGWGGAGLYETLGVEWMRPCEVGDTGPCRQESDRWYPTRFFFWFDDTRVIRSTPGDADTITEFPVFSFILGDLHPHVMSIPLALLVIGASAATWRGRSTLDFRTHRRNPLVGLVLGLLVGALAFQNAWDLPTFAGVFAVAVLARNLRRLPLLGAARASAGYLGPIAIVALVAYSPWIVDFGSQAEGLYPYVGKGSHPGQAFLQFGVLFVAALLLLLPAARRGSRDAWGDAALTTVWVPLGPLLLWIALAIYHGQLGDAADARGAGGWVTLLVYGFGAWALATGFAVTALERRPIAFPLGLATVGVLLFYGAELFLIRDVFFGGAPRLNTVFKLTYQAWILLSVAGAIGLMLALERARRRPVAWTVAGPAAALVVLGLVYVTIATPNRTDGFSGETTIDGLAFLARSDPGEYHLLQWLEDNVPGDSIVLEASGRAYGPGADGAPVVTDAGVDYTGSGRIAARTGLKTPIGWYFHEIQWRGDTEENRGRFRARQDLVDRAYLSTEGEGVLEVMREAGAEYLVVGTVERAKYGNLMAEFDDVLDLVFASGEHRIYRLPQHRVVPTS